MSLKENNRNYFDGPEDVPLLILSVVSTYGLFCVEAPIVLIGFVVFVDIVESIKVGKSIAEYIKDCIESKKIKKLEEQELLKEKNNNLEISKSNVKELDLEPKIDKTEAISVTYKEDLNELQINNEIENQNKSVKKFVLTKEYKRQY